MANGVTAPDLGPVASPCPSAGRTMGWRGVGPAFLGDPSHDFRSLVSLVFATSAVPIVASETLGPGTAGVKCGFFVMSPFLFGSFLLCRAAYGGSVIILWLDVREDFFSVPGCCSNAGLLSVLSVGNGGPRVCVIASGEDTKGAACFDELYVGEFLSGSRGFKLVCHCGCRLSGIMSGFCGSVNDLFFAKRAVASGEQTDKVFRRLFLSRGDYKCTVDLGDTSRLGGCDRLFTSVSELRFSRFRDRSGRCYPSRMEGFVDVRASVTEKRNRRIHCMPICVVTGPIDLVGPCCAGVRVDTELRGSAGFLHNSNFMLRRKFGGSTDRTRGADKFGQTFGGSVCINCDDRYICLGSGRDFVREPAKGGGCLYALGCGNYRFNVERFARGKCLCYSSEPSHAFNLGVDMAASSRRVGCIVLGHGSFFLGGLECLFRHNYFEFGSLEYGRTALDTLDC